MKNNFLQWIALCNPDPAHDPDPDPKKKTNSEKSLRNKTKFHEYHQVEVESEHTTQRTPRQHYGTIVVVEIKKTMLQT